MSTFEPAPHRIEVPVLERVLPLSHCSQAPPNVRTLAAADAYLASWSEHVMDWDAWVGQVEIARSTFARLIGADPDEVAVGSSVSQLTSAFASALEFTERDEIVVDADEFPTVSHVWRAQQPRGARVRPVDLGPEGGPVDVDLLSASGRARLVSVSLGTYAQGALRDLDGVAEVIHHQGALLFVDAYQALGTLPVDVRALGVDVLAGGCLKYLLGVPGLAFLYVRRELAEQLTPAVTGWFGRRDPFAFDPTLDWADGALRFDAGTPPVFEAYVCAAGMEWLLEVGLPEIRGWTLELSRRYLEGCARRDWEVLGPARAEHRTPLTAVRVEDAAGVERALRARGVVASARGQAIRFAPHFYNDLDDVDRSLDALERVLAR